MNLLAFICTGTSSYEELLGGLLPILIGGASLSVFCALTYLYQKWMKSNSLGPVSKIILSVIVIFVFLGISLSLWFFLSLVTC